MDKEVRSELKWARRHFMNQFFCVAQSVGRIEGTDVPVTLVMVTDTGSDPLADAYRDVTKGEPMIVVTFVPAREFCTEDLLIFPKTFEEFPVEYLVHPIPVEPPVK